MTWGQMALTLARKFQSAHVDEISDALNRAYDGILRERRWRGLVQSTMLVTSAPVTAGTVTVTLGSATVAGTLTAFDAAMVGRTFRLAASNEIYAVASVESTVALTLDRVFAEAPAADAAYRIFQDVFTLVAGIREVLSVRFPGSAVAVDPISYDQLRRYNPLPGVEGYPRVWAPFHDEADTYTGTTVKRIAVALIPDAVYGLQVDYLAVARGFDGSNTEESPMPFVDLNALLGGAQEILAVSPDQMMLARDLKAAGMMRMKNEDNRQTGPTRIEMAERFTRHRARRWTR